MGYRPHRYPTTYPVVLQQGEVRQNCFLINVTEGGAGLFDVTNLSPKDEVTLRCSVGNLDAIVQWIDTDQCGVVFKQRLGTRQIEQLRHAPTAYGAPRARTVQAFTELR